MLAEPWKQTFTEVVASHRYAGSMRQASLDARLGDWTSALTEVVVTTCERAGWVAASKSSLLQSLPERRKEYFGLDVTAFEPGSGWRFPVAAIELENDAKDDRIAYSLWKVLAVRARLRVVFCYRKEPQAAGGLVAKVGRSVIGALSHEERLGLMGDVLVVVGTRSTAGTFPHDFFRWFRLERNDGAFARL